MILYIVRHGIAIKKSTSFPDQWRYLTQKGRTQTEKMANRILKKSKPNVIVSSPLVRAVQTAEILANKINRKKNIIITAYLKPECRVDKLITFLKQFKQHDTIMVVGHEPQLGSFLSVLINQENEIYELKKSGCVALKVNFSKPSKLKFLWYKFPK